MSSSVFHLPTQSLQLNVGLIASGDIKGIKNSKEPKIINNNSPYNHSFFAHTPNCQTPC